MRLIDADVLKQSFNKFAEGYLDICEIIDSQPTINQLIPVSERLPEFFKPVLTISDEGDYAVLDYYHDLDIDGFEGWYNEDGYYCELDEITAWMPLPESYKEEE